MRFAAGPAAICAAAAVVTALALQLSSGLYDERALVLVTLGAVLSVAGAIWMRGGDQRDRLSAQVLFGTGATVGLALHVFENPTFYGDPRALEGFRWFAVISLVLLSAYLCLHLRASLIRARFLLLLACFFVMGIAVLRASPKPWVDVWHLQLGAVDALVTGHNPYSVGYPNIYGALTSRMYPPELLIDNHLVSFPYPPLAILLDVPARLLFGDVRYSLLALLVLSAWAIGRLGGVEGELAAVFVLFQPRTFFVLEQAWLEPVMLAAFALTALAVARWRDGKGGPVLAGVALGLLLASKQHSPYFALPLAFAFPAQGRWKALGVAALTCAAVLLPFAAWDWKGFWHGVVSWHFLLTKRDDALTWIAFWDRRGGAPEALVRLVPLFGLAVFALTLRPRMSLAQACAAAAAAFFVVAVAYKQAFCNYYWLCTALLAAAVAARTRPLEVAS